MSLKAKVISPILLLILTGLSIGLMGINKMYDQNKSLRHFSETITPRMLLAQDANLALARMAVNFLYMTQGEKQEDVESAWKKIGDQYQILQSKSKKYKSLATDEERKVYKQFLQNMSEYYEESKSAYNLLLQGKKSETQPNITRAREKRLTSQKLIDALIDTDANTIETSVNAQNDAYQQGWIEMLIIGLVAVTISGGLGLILLNGVTTILNSITDRLKESSKSVKNASMKIANSSASLSLATTQEASSLVQTATAVDQMTATIHQNTKNAENSAEAALSGEHSAKHGQEVIEKMIKTIHEIRSSNEQIGQSIDDSNRKFSEITHIINEIGTKTCVINDIVFQTKLLSFNASVEAARAGEAGKGFAVVAEEVGTLAQMSGSAAKEISDMLEASIHKVNQIINETQGQVKELLDVVKERITTGNQVAGECGKVLNEIVERTSEVTKMSQFIADSSREQAKPAQEIASAMNQLNQVTHSNSVTAQETAHSGKELSQLSGELSNVVEELTSVITGNS